MNIDVKSFLKDERNSVIREKLVNYHFFYEVKLSGARIGNDIQISFPEIDKEGYDIVLDDGRNIKVFQIKTRLQDSKTIYWNIQKQLLRPKYEHLKLFDFEEIGQNIGFEGGVILIEIATNKETITSHTYYYCDIYILKAIEHELIPVKSRNNYKAVLKVIHSLKSDGHFNRHEKVFVPKCAFVKVNNVDSLLSLANLLSIREDFRYWRGGFEICLKENDIKFNGSNANAIKYLLAE